jgi:hypothetical protein
LFICNQEVAGLETVHVPFVVSDTSDVPPSGSKETSVTETVSVGSSSSPLLEQDTDVTITHSKSKIL